VLTGLAVFLDRTLESVFLDDLTGSMLRQARAVRAGLPAQGSDLQPTVVNLGRELALRITVIGADGTVLADSTRDPATMENHGDRPEVRAALRGVTGVASRISETVGTPFRYVALPERDDTVIRVALPLSIVEERLKDVRTPIVAGAAVPAIARGAPV
jgi:two-component system, OmpR family, phosphate regulon sensor histidine kinase PhoR